MAQHHPRRAAAALEEGLGLLVPERERTRAVMLTYRAHAALANHDVDAAVADLRSYAQQRLTSVRVCANSLPGHRNELDASHDRRVTNSAQEQ